MRRARQKGTQGNNSCHGVREHSAVSTQPLAKAGMFFWPGAHMALFVIDSPYIALG